MFLLVRRGRSGAEPAGRTAAIAATVIAVATLAAPARAEGAYNATVAGQSSPTPLVALVSSSVLTVDVVNLPAGVGLYALHCKVPADPRQPPTVCDASNDALAYLPADAAAQGTTYSYQEDFAYPIAASAQNTATTIVAPATTAIIWRVSAGFYLNP